MRPLNALDRVTSRNGLQFSYVGASNELASDGTTTFSRGPAGELQALRNGAETRMTLADRHGDVIAGFDPTAYDITMNDTAEFDPFGKRVDSSGTERPIGYQGDYTDPDTGDVNMTARWYDPTTGTFTSRDSIDLPTSPSSASNRYSYAGGSPLNYTDSTGHDFFDEYCRSNPDGFICQIPYIWSKPPGGAGSGLGGLPDSSGCGSPVPPDKKAFGCCPADRAFASCAAGGTGPSGMAGGWSGSGGGSFSTGGGRNGHGASPPRPDPAIAARAANRAAALNNPAPIPQAMFTPMYGGSIAPPVSSAPDLPSHRASDYRDPINDVNKSYQRLQESLTTDHQTLLGQVKDTTAAPSEIIQAKSPTDQNAIDDKMREAYENAQACGAFNDAELQSCINKAPFPDFQGQVDAELALQGMEAVVPLFEGIAYGSLGVAASTLCAASVYCGAALAAPVPEGMAFWPWVGTMLYSRALVFGGGATVGMGNLISVNARDKAAVLLAERIGGRPSIRFENDPTGTRI